MINFEETAEFKKDFKKLLKRYCTLKEDFETMKKFTLIPHYENGVATAAFVPIEGFCSREYVSIKIRKFSCRALKGRGAASGIRVIAVWRERVRTLTFVQIYTKSDATNEDRNRLRNFINSIAGI